MSEILAIEDEIIESAETRMVELGAEIAQRMFDGKNSPDLLDRGQRILSVKRAYNEGLSDKEKEGLLYCLRRLSEKYDVPSVTQSNVLEPFIPAPVAEEPFVDFYVGSDDDAEGYIGTGVDTENFIGK